MMKHLSKYLESLDKEQTILLLTTDSEIINIVNKLGNKIIVRDTIRNVSEELIDNTRIEFVVIGEICEGDYDYMMEMFDLYCINSYFMMDKKLNNIYMT